MARRTVNQSGLGESIDVDSSDDSRSEQTRKRIRDAAAHILSVNGYAGLRLTDVAALAKVHVPGIYYYYGSRDELIEEVMWTGTAETREHTAAVLESLGPDASPTARLLAAVEAHLRHMLEISDYSKAAIRNAGQVPQSIRDRQLLEEVQYGELWRHLFSDLMRSGDLRPEYDPYAAQMLMMGSLNWVLEWWDPRRSAVDFVVANALHYVRNAVLEPRPARRRRS